MKRSTRGRHRRGMPGLVWCRELPSVHAALAAPAIARRGLFERLLATSRHLAPGRAATRPAPGSFQPALG